jgi:putative tricarboxylic transport membrane protein
MFNHRSVRTSLIAFVLAVASLACITASHAQWKPERRVEIIVGVGAGGALDLTARLVQKIWQEHRIVTVPMVVNNKPGGGNTVALTYLSQYARDPHLLTVSAPTMLTSHIVGSSTFHHNDFTPVAMLMSEPVFVVVNANSPVKTGKDLIARLKQAPESLSVGISTALGNHIHLGVALPMKAAGVDIKRMKTVVFPSASQSLTALLGAHIDVLAGTVAIMLPHVASGRVRVIGMSGSQRMSGDIANAPTWKEQGANAVFDAWRGVLGAKDITEAQARYWETALAVATQTDEWRKDMERNHRTNNYLNSQDTRKYLDDQYRELKDALTELGLAKR